MRPSKNAYCVIKVARRDRRLFTLIEKPTGDLMVGFQAVDVMGAGFGKKYEGQRITSQKYSIHPSNDSHTLINAIKHKLVLESGDVVCGEHYTEAIKQHGKFAYIASAMCPNLDQEKYVPPKRALKKIALGSYEPNLMSLHYALFVGSRELPFSLFENYDFNYDFMDFALFRFVVLWSFAPIASGAPGIKAHGITIKPEEVAAEDKHRQEQIVKGLTPEGCASAFRMVRECIHETLLASVVSNDPGFAESAERIRSWGHFKAPIPDPDSSSGTAI